MLIGEQRSSAVAAKLFRGEVEKRRKGSTAPASLKDNPQGGSSPKSSPLDSATQLLHAQPAVVPSRFSPRDTFTPRFRWRLVPSPKRPTSLCPGKVGGPFPYRQHLAPIRAGKGFMGTFLKAPLNLGLQSPKRNNRDPAKK